MQVGWVDIGDCRQITGYISKTVQDRRIVSTEVEKEVICALSNIVTTLCVYLDGKVAVVFNRNCFPKNDRLFNVKPPAGSHVVYNVKRQKW